ncbi:hypothetical protein [Nitrospira sp. Kam-Ns4a]
MLRRIRSAEDLALLLEHANAFQGGQITDLHVHKHRLFDEASGREVTAATTITAVIQYELPVRAAGGAFSVTRVAKLTMTGVTDFSIFEQEGADCSEIGTIHAEAAGGRLRFWFDPRGELYVICDEAEIEEVSRPGTGRLVPRGRLEWTFQAERGDLPPVSWFLDHLDRAGLPCAWRAAKRSGPAHPLIRWEGCLVPAGAPDEPRGGVYIQSFGPLDGRTFGISLRATEEGRLSDRLLAALADLITRQFPGTCLAGNVVLDRDEWLEGHSLGLSP